MKKSFIYTFIFIGIITLLSTLYYYDSMDSSLYKCLKLIVFLLYLLITSKILEQTKRNSGFFLPTIFIIISILCTYLTKKLTLSLFLYYAMILSSSLLGIYIARKKKRKA